MSSPVGWPTPRLLFGLTFYGATVTDDAAATTAALLIVLAVVVIGPIVRRPYMHWVAWVASATGAAFLSHRLGVGAGELRYVLLAWGAAVLVGGLTADDLWSGRRLPGQWVRRRSLKAPVVLGASTAAVALATSFVQTPWRYGWASAFAAVVVLVVAWQLRRGGLSVLSWLLAAVAYGALAPWEPLTEPWTFVPVVALMVVVAEVMATMTSRAVGPAPVGTGQVSTGDLAADATWILPGWADVWDAAALIAAHVVALVALGAALENGFVTATWAGIGAIAILLDIRRRTGAWAVAGTAMVLFGCGYENWAWLSLGLGVTAVVSAVLAEVLDVRWRRLLQASCVAAAAGSFASALAWQAVDLQGAATATSVAVVVVASALAVGMGIQRLDRSWLSAWAPLVPIGLIFSAIALTEPDVAPSPTGQALALALAASAVATGLAARRYDQPWLREAAAVVLAAAGWPLAYGTQATPVQVTVAASAVAWAAAAVLIALVVVPAGSGRAGVWARPTALLAGVALITAPVAGVSAGPGWLCVALTEVAVLASAAGWVVPRPSRLVLSGVGTASAAGAWIALGVWAEWTLETAVVMTALVVAALALVLGACTRIPRLDQGVIGLWSAPVVVGLFFGVIELSSTQVDRWPPGGVVAMALAAAAVGAASAATPTGQGWLRQAAAGLVLAAGWVLAYAATATASQIVVSTAVVGALVTFFVAAIETADDDRVAVLRPWVQPGQVVGVIAAVTSVGVAFHELPARPLLVAALLLVGVDMAALGLVGRRPTLLTLAPVPIGFAWLVFASEALTGNAQWFTVPIGCTLLAVVALARWQRRREGLDAVTTPIVVLDTLGMVLVVSAALVQTVTENIAYGLLGVVLGGLLAGWGVLTRVRRRLMFGAATIALAVALMVLVPLAGLLPQARSPLLWLAIAALGLVAIVVAAFIERGRSTVVRMTRSFLDLTSGWEGWSATSPPESPAVEDERAPEVERVGGAGRV